MSWTNSVVASFGDMPFHDCKASQIYGNLGDYDFHYNQLINLYTYFNGKRTETNCFQGDLYVSGNNNDEQQEKLKVFYDKCLLVPFSGKTEIEYGNDGYVDLGNGTYLVFLSRYSSKRTEVYAYFVHDLQDTYTGAYLSDTSKAEQWFVTTHPDNQFFVYKIFYANITNFDVPCNGFGWVRYLKNNDTGDSSYDSGTFGFICNNFFDFIGGSGVEEKSSSDEYGNESTSGGYGGGSFDRSSDGMGLPELPSIGVSDSGMINVYRVTRGQLDGFASDLFPDFPTPTPSTKEGLEGVVENLANTASVIGYFADSYINAGLVNYIIDCHVVPVTPSFTDNNGIKVGFKTFDYDPKRVTSDYVEIDCGSLQIKEYYQNFLDYIGTRAKLYLPFIGFVDIKPEWFQSGKLQVIYHFNVIDGSCIAFILATSSKSTIKDTVVATFGGNACVHIPITGVNYASMISGVVGSIGTMSSAVATRDIGGVFTGVTDLLSAKPTLEQSNGYNAGMSFMSYRTPYLLIERPVASFSKNYPHEQGLPLNVTRRLGTLSGFTKASNANLDGILCNSEEKDMIQTALAEGIIL